MSYQRKLLWQIWCQRSQNTYVTVLYRLYDTETIRFFYGVDWLRCLMLTALTCNQKRKLIIFKIIPNEILICLSLATVGRNTTLSALIADVWSGEFMLLIIILKKYKICWQVETELLHVCINLIWRVYDVIPHIINVKQKYFIH